jgi:cyclohexanone monooxygenase
MGTLLNGKMEPFAQMGKEKYIEYLEEYWNDVGGFDFFSICADLIINKEAEDVISDFVRDKIKTTVKDPIVAEKLTPKFGYVCKRPLLGTDYFETYNLPHVTLNTIHDNPIVGFTESGIQLKDGSEHNLDAVVFATGFDAFFGPFNAIEFVGENGQILSEKFSERVSTYLGLQVSGFPNLLMLSSGFQTPAALACVTFFMEIQSKWIGSLLTYMKTNAKSTVSPGPEGEKAWSDLVDGMSKMVLFTSPNCNSWYLGSNIPGKKRQYFVYVAGLPSYIAKLEEETQKNYQGFIFT